MIIVESLVSSESGGANQNEDIKGFSDIRRRLELLAHGRELTEIERLDIQEQRAIETLSRIAERRRKLAS